MKDKIQANLNLGITDGVLADIQAYEKQYPFDLDIISMKAIYFFLIEEYEQAIDLLQAGLKKNPYMIDFYYNLSSIYEAQGNLIKAYEYLYRIYVMNPKAESEILPLAETMELGIEAQLKQDLPIEELDKKRKAIRKLSAEIKAGFDYHLVYPWSYGEEKEQGKRLKTNPNYYIARYNRLGRIYDPNLCYDKTEIIKVLAQQQAVSLKIKEPSYIPVALTETGKFRIQCGEKQYNPFQVAEQFYYYRTDQDIEFSANEGTELIVGHPIPLHNKTEHKKSLILTIFVDGLSQAFLEEYGFEQSMPETAEYFSDGLHFTNFYSTGEWTYPSMAGYFSGRYTVEHKMFYPDVDYQLPKDIPVLGECVKQAGYMTAKIDGDWRTNPDYGYIRGMDRVLTGSYGEEMNIKQVISEAMDHMETMKDTNQYLYINIGELHDVTDDYKLPIDVRKNLCLAELDDESGTGTTSVKQQFNYAKKRRYQEQMKYVDRYLGILFDYLNKNFAEDEIIVTLFSDHGQGYLVQNNDFFLEEERTKVPLLVKGVTSQKTICDEYLSSLDYLPILGKLAGFDVDISKRSSVLPKFFQGTGRKYVVSESLYPGDTYKIALRNDTIKFFFESKEPVGVDARVNLDTYDCWLLTPEGNILEDDDLKNECIRYVMKHIGYFRKYEM